MVTPSLIAPKSGSTNVPVFAFAPVRPTTYRGAELALTLDADDYFEETADAKKAIVALRADAGDGTGWQALDTEQAVTASYDSTGTKVIALEATLADGSVLSASASIQVAALMTPNPTETLALKGGQLYVYKSDNHAGLRCPVFVVEGFDMKIVAKAAETIGQIGDPRSIQALVEIAGRKGRLFTTAEPLPVRLAACKALLALGTPAASEALFELVAAEPWHRDRTALQQIVNSRRSS